MKRLLIVFSPVVPLLEPLKHHLHLRLKTPLGFFTWLLWPPLPGHIVPRPGLSAPLSGVEMVGKLISMEMTMIQVSRKNYVHDYQEVRYNA